VGLLGTANQLTVTGTSPITTSGSWTLSIPSILTLPGTINKLTLTPPTTGATLTLADGSSLISVGAFASTFTFTGTTGVTFPITGTLATTADANFVKGAANLTTTAAIPIQNGTTGTLTEDGTYLVWDATNHRLNLGGGAVLATNKGIGIAITDNSSETPTFYSLNSGSAASFIRVGRSGGRIVELGANNSSGNYLTNGIADATFLTTSGTFQIGQGYSSAFHTFFTNGNEKISTGAATDAGGDLQLQIQKAVAPAGVISTGTKFTISGCSADTTLGGATSGTFVSHTTGTCTVVITMNGATGLTTNNKWTCAPQNLTTANLIRQTAGDATTCTVSGTTVDGDVISFLAMGS
jgi:hypothetical protein